MPVRLFLLLITCLGGIGCADIPQVGVAQASAAREAPYPSLVNLDALLAGATAMPARITPATTAAMNDRVAALRARAARLRGPVVDPATRSQMRAASARAALR